MGNYKSRIEQDFDNMKGIAFLSGLISGLLTLGVILPASSQVTSDNTTKTTVNLNGNNFKIINGIQKGSNLFHSFKEFSIPTGSEAVFNNSPDVVNIINRVTGGNISNIDGLIKASGNANLFLINPAGIVFGENARLNIGGSFFASTASSILFEDGFEFSAVNPQNKPLLTVSVPLGLQMGKNPGEIQVQGTGSNLIDTTQFSPLIGNTNESNLQVKPGNTLALLGGEIMIDGGILTAKSGNIELGSVAEGTVNLVNLNNTNQEFTFDYQKVSKFKNIELSQESLIDASGVNTGSVMVHGKNVTFRDGSKIVIQNQGLKSSGNIYINASDLLKISSMNLDETLFSGLLIDTLGEANNGDIILEGKNLIVENAGLISNYTYGSGSGGNINLNFSESIDLSGISPISKRSSAISAITYNSGNTGDVNVSTKKLTISDAGFLGTATFGSGNAGDVRVNSTESIGLIGVSPLSQSSVISSSTFASGNAGKLTVNTKKLSVRDGARIDSSATVLGNSGSITVNATESVEVSGVSAASSPIPSLINSSANILDENVRKLLGLPDKPFADSGDLTINTPKLVVKDGAFISVQNQGFGNGGILEINAKSIFIDTQGRISAATQSGEGGNINLNVQESLIIRRGSGINTESLGTGNGGNLNINSPVIAGFENSDIVANAVKGNGGNIDITTSGIFGLKFRDELTQESDITASSQFGINGMVKVNNIGIDPSSGLTELPVKLADSSQQIAAGCSSNTENTFVATGRGGIPHNPNQNVNINRTWSDVRDLSASLKRNNTEVTTISNKPAIVEATGFIRNENGEIELVALQNIPFNTQVLDCSGNT
ncbi:MAG: filamentous hemagglutinin N-terminal domain-containing protein [Rivularia sp. (in: cyanobacteria)]